MSDIIEVAAAVILREGCGGSEYLLARRPAGKVYADYWEFPGGKVEPGETCRQALIRELQEELGIAVDRAWPWLTREFIYPHAHVRLKFFRVPSWHGEIVPIEHSGIVWTRIADVPAVSPVLPANGPILDALALPPRYAVTNAEEYGIKAELQRLEGALRGGLQLIQLRDKGLPAAERLRFARAVMKLASTHPESCVLVNDDESLAREIGAPGLHLSASRLMALTVRPPFERVASSCHDADELARAAALGLDFAVLSPVLPTASHPGAPGIGWEDFSRLVEPSPLPVFALGGMRPELLDTARCHGAHGIALLRKW